MGLLYLYLYMLVPNFDEICEIVPLTKLVAIDSTDTRTRQLYFSNISHSQQSLKVMIYFPNEPSILQCTVHMFTTYSTYVHNVQYICSQCTVHMFTMYSTYVHNVQYICSQHTIHMFTIYSTYVHNVQYICSQIRRHHIQINHTCLHSNLQILCN
jgi:hypothetical protein